MTFSQIRKVLDAGEAGKLLTKLIRDDAFIPLLARQKAAVPVLMQV